MNRREVIQAIFGAGMACPVWLEKLLLAKHSTQITETPNHGASARGIVERVLKGSDTIDDLVKTQLSTCDCVNDPYFHGLYNGLLLAQKTLQDEEYDPT